MTSADLVTKLDREVGQFFGPWISPARKNRKLQFQSLAPKAFMDEFNRGRKKPTKGPGSAFLSAFYDTEKDCLFFRSDANLVAEGGLVAHELIHSYANRYTIGTWALEEAFTEYLTQAFCDHFRYPLGLMTCYMLHSTELDTALKGKPKEDALAAIALFHFQQNHNPLVALAGNEVIAVLKRIQTAITGNCAL